MVEDGKHLDVRTVVVQFEQVFVKLALFVVDGLDCSNSLSLFLRISTPSLSNGSSSCFFD
jgi:hypothetical protein